jgi:PBP1b-binding outer membrane lipoprotein LpoB
MRKLLAILLSILIIGTVFVGCTQKSPPVDEQPANQDNQDVETETQDQDQEVPAEDEDETDEVVEVGFEVLDIEDLDEDLQGQVEDLIKEEGLVVLDEENSIVLVSLGERPTGGYALTAAVEKQQDEILVKIAEIEPDEDAATTQVITYPYIILKIDGDVSNIKLVEAENVSDTEDVDTENEEVDTEDSETPSSTEEAIEEASVNVSTSMGVSKSVSVGQSGATSVNNSQGVSYSRSKGNSIGVKKIGVERHGLKPEIQ